MFKCSVASEWCGCCVASGRVLCAMCVRIVVLCVLVRGVVCVVCVVCVVSIHKVVIYEEFILYTREFG